MAPEGPALGGARLGLIGLAAMLAVVPGLPFLESPAVAFVRFHNWSIFAGGMLLGWLLAEARASLR